VPKKLFVREWAGGDACSVNLVSQTVSEAPLSVADVLTAIPEVEVVPTTNTDVGAFTIATEDFLGEERQVVLFGIAGRIVRHEGGLPRREVLANDVVELATKVFR
jgi:hypothetical protein